MSKRVFIVLLIMFSVASSVHAQKEPQGDREALQLKLQRLNAIVAERAPLADRMQELARQHGNDLTALQKIEEWNDLHTKVTALNAQYEKVRKEQFRIAIGGSKTIVGQSAKTVQYDPFPSTNKIEYARAVEMAKEGDASAFYWLSYYFAKGEGIDQNPEAAYRFLVKAEESGYSRASYMLGRLYELYSLREDGSMNRRERWSPNSGGMILNPFDGHEFWGRWDSLCRGCCPTALKGNLCYTNAVATAYVMSLYEKSVRGGFPCATNDIARMNRKIVECSERIQKNMLAQKKAVVAQKERAESARKALSILEEEDNAKKVRENEARKRAEEEAKSREVEVIAKVKAEEEKRAREAEEREKKQAEMEVKQREENELWSSWPNKLDGAGTLKIAEQAAKKFNCTFYGDFSYGALSDWGVSFTNSWKRGCGVSLIAEKQIWSGRAVEKFDSEGRLVWVCSMDGLTEDAEELNWVSAERKVALEASQLKWATEHGMTLDEAKAKYAKWKEEHPIGRPLGGLRRSGMFGGGLLRARRLQRQQESGSQAK